MRTTQQQGRFAGFLYLLLGLSAPLGLVIVPEKLFVSGDAAATADNLRASEGLLRAGMASEIVHQVLFIYLVVALYRLFRAVDEDRSRQLVLLGAMSVPILFVNVLNEIAALILVQGPDYLSAFDAAQRDGLAYLFIRLHGQGLNVASLFWGLWLFPFALLVLRSGFIPRLLGYLLFVAGGAYVAISLTTLVVPPFAPLIGRFAEPLLFAEVPIIFWLVIRGANTESPLPRA